MNIDWNAIGGAATAAGFVIGGLFRLWGAIKKKLDAVGTERAEQFQELKAHLQNVVERHEERDDERHRDNLAEFKSINRDINYIRVALAHLGWRNGTAPEDQRGD